MSCFQEGKLRNLWIAAAIFFFGSFLFAQAMIAPQVYLTKIEIQKESFQPRDKISGIVSLWNYENHQVSDLVFHFQLLGGEKDGVATQMIDEKIGGAVFSLGPGKKTVRPFNYSLPSNLPRGIFKFRVLLANSRGEEMGWIDKVVSIGGENKFLTLENTWLLKGGKEFSAGGGVNYGPGEKGQAVFDVANGSNFTIGAFPRMTTYKRDAGGEILSQVDGKSIVLGPGQRHSLDMDLPLLPTAGTYLSEIQFYDANNRESISNAVYFRWVVTGKDNAAILFVTSDRASYKAGDKAKVTARLAGPAYTGAAEEPAASGKIKVKLLDQQGNLIGRSEKAIPLESGKISLEVPVKGDVADAKIDTEVVKGDKILDRYQVSPLGQENLSQTAPAPSGQSGFSKWPLVLISAVLVVLVLVIWLAIYSKLHFK